MLFNRQISHCGVEHLPLLVALFGGHLVALFICMLEEAVLLEGSRFRILEEGDGEEHGRMVGVAAAFIGLYTIGTLVFCVVVSLQYKRKLLRDPRFAQRFRIEG